MLMVEHNLNVVANAVGHDHRADARQVLAEGDYATVSKNPQVQQAYMGARP
jgi:branched-chain amino acid transport system ATP-binding protein